MKKACCHKCRIVMQVSDNYEESPNIPAICTSCYMEVWNKAHSAKGDVKMDDFHPAAIGQVWNTGVSMTNQEVFDALTATESIYLDPFRMRDLTTGAIDESLRKRDEESFYRLTEFLKKIDQEIQRKHG